MSIIRLPKFTDSEIKLGKVIGNKIELDYYGWKNTLVECYKIRELMLQHLSEEGKFITERFLIVQLNTEEHLKRLEDRELLVKREYTLKVDKYKDSTLRGKLIDAIKFDDNYYIVYKILYQG